MVQGWSTTDSVERPFPSTLDRLIGRDVEQSDDFTIWCCKAGAGLDGFLVLASTIPSTILTPQEGNHPNHQ